MGVTDAAMNPSNEPLSVTLAEINRKLDTLTRTVGEESDDGKSGTGLFGEVRRNTLELAALKSLRDRGLGLMLGVLLFGAIVALGFKQAATTILGLFK
jgi:hypothetical protein